MVRSSTTANSLLPAGVATCTSSPTLRFRRARPMGEVVEISPCSTSASSLLTSLYSMRTSFWVSMTTILEPKPERSVGMLVRLSMPKSPMRFFNWAMRALTKPCRSLAYLYSAFSERSPCARATAISLGRSTFSSWSSWSISSCSFFLIFAIGSDMRLHQKRFAGEGFWKVHLPPPRSTNYRCDEIAGTSAVLPISVHLHRHLLGDAVAVGTLGREGVSGCCSGLNVHAQVVRRPDLAILRLERDGPGVGDAEANLRGFAPVNSGCGIQHLNRELAAAELFDRRLILLPLFFGLRVRSALVVSARVLMPGKNNPSDVQGDDEDQQRGIHEWILEDAFLRGLIF